MRVAVIGINYAPESTGIAPYASAAARSLAESGHDVHVITGLPHYPQWKVADGYGGWKSKEVIDGVRVLRLWHNVSAGLLGRTLMETWFGLRASLRSWFGADVALAPSPALLTAAAVVARARLTGRAAVVWLQDIYTLGASQTGKATGLAGIIRAVESWTLRNATRVMVIHQRFADFATAELGVDPERIDVVRNWTHLADDRPPRSAALRERFGWAADDIVVLHAGNMGAKQNLENVVRASELAAARDSRVRFVLLGDGHRREALTAMGTNPRLQFIGSLPEADFEQALTSADILLVNELPGMTEMSVPSKLTSYFNSGLPVLAAVDAGSVTAAEVEAAGAGIRVDPDAPSALLDGAERLASDPALCTRLGAAGLVYRRTVLSATTATRAIEDVLHRAAQRS